MSVAAHDPTTYALDALRIALAQAQGLVCVLARCAVSDEPLPALGAAAIADGMTHFLGNAETMLNEARGAHALSVAQERLSLEAAAARHPLRVVAGLDHAGAREA